MISMALIIAVFAGFYFFFLLGRVSMMSRINQAEGIISTFKLYLTVWSMRGQQSDITKGTELEIEKYERTWKK